MIHINREKMFNYKINLNYLKKEKLWRHCQLFLAIYCQKYRPLCIFFHIQQKCILHSADFYISLHFFLTRKKQIHLFSYDHPLHKGPVLYFYKKYLFSYCRHLFLLLTYCISFFWFQHTFGTIWQLSVTWCSEQTHLTLPFFSFSLAAPHCSCFLL